ncbi:MAG: hypothetical protein ACRD0K_09815 [Egibacteraceae bacterium]
MSELPLHGVKETLLDPDPEPESATAGLAQALEVGGLVGGGGVEDGLTGFAPLFGQPPLDRLGLGVEQQEGVVADRPAAGVGGGDGLAVEE